MKTIEATYRIVTPMFIGGADGKPSDGIRPPSFKGALRFWWRALNWGKFYQEAKGDEAVAMKKLHSEESRLFGSAVKDKKGGQGAFLLSIEQPKAFSEEKVWPKLKPIGESGYLGTGLWESGSIEKKNHQEHRVALYSNHPFIVRLCFHNEDDILTISEALKALGLLGGLGSRSRRGFGSIALDTINGDSFSFPQVEAYEKQLLSSFQALEKCDIMPPFTACSLVTRIGRLQGLYSSYQEAHKAAAKLFYKVRGMKAEVRGVNKRGFGQPLPLKPMKIEYDQRRSSPLFFHIHPIGNQFICSHIFMPSQFLPYEGNDMSFYNGVETYMDKLQEVQL